MVSVRGEPIEDPGDAQLFLRVFDGPYRATVHRRAQARGIGFAQWAVVIAGGAAFGIPLLWVYGGIGLVIFTLIAVRQLHQRDQTFRSAELTRERHAGRERAEEGRSRSQARSSASGIETGRERRDS